MHAWKPRVNGYVIHHMCLLKLNHKVKINIYFRKNLVVVAKQDTTFSSKIVAHFFSSDQIDRDASDSELSFFVGNVFPCYNQLGSFTGLQYRLSSL
jgi:hypothetical protein